MSLAQQIRDALGNLKQGASLSVSELAELCDEATSSTGIASLMHSAVARGEVIRTGAPGEYRYQANPAYTPADRGAAVAAGITRRRKADAKPPKTKAKAPRKPRAPKPPKPPKAGKPVTTTPQRALRVVEPTLDTHVVALQADGGVFVMDRASGEYHTVPPLVAREIARPHTLVAR